MAQEGSAILVAVFTLAFLGIAIVLLFLIFQKRKNTLLLEQKEAEKRFEQEISKTQIEIREETFRNISWELHDNIGQLITLAKIQLQNSSDIEEVKITLNKGLQELRALSKLINPEALKNITLVNAIKQEVERLNRLNYIETELDVIGNEQALEHKVEIIFFRIIQEFFSNTIKHAKAKHLRVTLNYTPETLLIIVKDDGQGFDSRKPYTSGIGLSNIKNRAKLIDAEAIIVSKPNQGTELRLKYKYPL